MAPRKPEDKNLAEAFYKLLNKLQGTGKSFNQALASQDSSASVLRAKENPLSLEQQIAASPMLGVERALFGGSGNPLGDRVQPGSLNPTRNFSLPEELFADSSGSPEVIETPRKPSLSDVIGQFLSGVGAPAKEQIEGSLLDLNPKYAGDSTVFMPEYGEDQNPSVTVPVSKYSASEMPKTSEMSLGWLLNAAKGKATEFLEQFFLDERQLHEGKLDLAAQKLTNKGSPLWESQGPKNVDELQANLKFTNTLKKVENGRNAGRNETGFWTPHPSVEGGLDTLGYGHKLTPEENKSGKIELDNGRVLDFRQGLSDEEIHELLQNDILKHKDIAEQSWDLASKTGIKFKDLDPKYQYAVVNLAFNVGDLVRNGQFRWGNMAEAIKKGDDQAVADNMITFYNPVDKKTKKPVLDKNGNKVMLPLLERAQAFADALGFELTGPVKVPQKKKAPAKSLKDFKA